MPIYTAELSTEQPLGEAIEEQTEHVSSLMSSFAAMLRSIFPSLVSAVIVLAAGILLTRLLLHLVERALRRSNADPTATGFLASLLRAALYVLVVIIVLSIVGVPMTSIITVVGTMGLAIGLALQDSLSNVAGGFILLFSKPLKKGDFVSFDGYDGTVERISMLQTKIIRIDGTAVFIPNRKVADAVILNYSEDPRRRVDLDFSIAYDADAGAAKEIIRGVLRQHPHAILEPAPIVRIGALADSAVILHVRVWTLHEHYWELYYDLHEQIKDAFDQAGIAIPFPQVDVHMHEAKSLKA